MKNEFEKKKSEIEQNFGKKIENLKSKFGNGGVDFIEEHLQSSTAGLITNQQFKLKKEHIELSIAQEEERLIEKEKQDEMERKEQKMLQKRLRNQYEEKSKLSFYEDEEENDEPPVMKRKNFGKNPDVNTRFLQVSNWAVNYFRKTSHANSK